MTTPDGDVPLVEGEYELVTVVGTDSDAPSTVAAAVLPSGGFVVLDLALDDALLAEGYARDVVRDVQDARKAADLTVGDRIVLTLEVPADRLDAVAAHRDLIAKETLAVEITVEESPDQERHVTVAPAAGHAAPAVPSTGDTPA